MPSYDYKCVVCDHSEAHIAKYDNRKHMRTCSLCGNSSEYQFPLRAIKGFQPFETYHDEGLGVDISGRRERRQVMNALGLQEAGDSVGGSRNYIGGGQGIGRPTGKRLSQEQYKQDAARKARDNKTIATVNRDGSETIHRVGDLSTDYRKSVAQGSKIGKGK